MLSDPAYLRSTLYNMSRQVIELKEQISRFLPKVMPAKAVVNLRDIDPGRVPAQADTAKMAST